MWKINVNETGKGRNEVKNNTEEKTIQKWSTSVRKSGG